MTDMQHGMSRWSEAQERAIATRSSELLVSAGAGSGKTSVLVERVLTRVLREGVDLDELLVVTFTEAAAQEMKERIEAALYEATKLPDGARAASQLQKIERAQISTLHSFCLTVLRLGALDLPVAPGFRISDGNEAALLFDRVLSDWLDDWLAQADEEQVRFALRYGGKGERLQRVIQSLDRYARSQPDPLLFVKRMADMYRENAAQDFAATPYAKLYTRYVIRQLANARQSLIEAYRWSRAPGGPDVYAPRLEAEIEALERMQQLAGSLDWHALAQASGSVFDKLPREKGAQKDIKKRVTDLRDSAKRQLAKLHLSERTPAVLTAQIQGGLADVEQMAAILEGVMKAFTEAKKAQGMVDFQDLEHMAHDLLRSARQRPESTVARELFGRYQEVYVDEYQDTSPLQDAILQALAELGQPSLFVVGDVKQSIYRFRMAEPSLFLGRSRAAAGMGNLIAMNENYRSRKEVVDAVNLVFRQVFSESLGGFAYDESAQMIARADYPDNNAHVNTLAANVELHLVESGTMVADEEDGMAGDEDNVSIEEDADSTDDTDWLEDLVRIEREGHVIAARIQALMGGGYSVYDAREKGYRPLAYRDIAILLRSNQSRVNALQGVLRRAGIPAHGKADSGFFNTYEIRLALALLRIIDNPLQDIELIAVLRSFIGDFRSSDLALVRMHQEGAFADAFFAYVEDAKVDVPVGGKIMEKGRRFLARLDRWRTAARTSELPVAVAGVLREAGLFAYFRVAPGGDARVANLAYLEQMAEGFDQMGQHRFSAFVRYLDDQQTSGEVKLGEASAVAETDDVVRIMTIHKSKGLEFPVVFVVGLGNQFNVRHDSPFYLQRNCGFGLVEVDLDRRERAPTVTSLALAELELSESLAEEARVLYVAMTRARERLILIGSIKNAEQEAANARERVRGQVGGEGPLPDAYLWRAKDFLGWILPAIYRAIEGEKVFRVQVWDRPEVFARFAGIGARDGGWMDRLFAFDASLFAPETPEACANVDALQAQLLTAVQASERSSTTAMAAKISVTEWRKRQERALRTVGGEEDEGEELADLRLPATPDWAMTRPRFAAQHDTPTAAEQGTNFHLYMQHLELSDDRPDSTWLTSEWRRLVNLGVLTDAGGSDAIRAAERFFAGGLGQRLWQARRYLRRELPFMMALPADRLDPAAKSGDKVVVQGVVDAAFAEDGKLVLVDYKTDRVPASTHSPALAEKYSLQLQLYAEAMAKGYHKPVSEAWLYFARADLAILVLEAKE